ncbi:ankyrin repeat domain-containing protein 39-like isoform 1 [Planoprotostelium fungivorum]|uniref:Ankyrin repeat domain-containing protein 39-like isoform 1 n=1 Tax=Planoprotostelium fungivorum TaxID=1890364 RepID=A0A2P6NTN6_9EUKA|nr:ankyrin repeat domain-containing protein 39-like isoform 1 [Planoprotostelium fungivorum]
MSHNHSHTEACQCAGKSQFGQSLDELEFQRGLWSSASSGNLSRVSSLISSGRDVNEVDTSGYTALHYAARNGHVDICRLLTSKGASPNARTKADATPLHRAAYRGNVKVIELLIAAGATLDAIDDEGMTPLHKAASERQNDAFEFLSQQGASTELKDKKGRTASEIMNRKFRSYDLGVMSPTRFHCATSLMR